jgi:hypothetical protein
LASTEYDPNDKYFDPSGTYVAPVENVTIDNGTADNAVIDNAATSGTASDSVGDNTTSNGMAADQQIGSDQSKKEIVSCFRNMIDNPILPIDQELLREDRIKLDNLILKSLNLNMSIRVHIYKSFLKMYQIRKAVKM